MFVVFEFNTVIIGSEHFKIVACLNSKQDALEFAQAHCKPYHSPTIVVDGIYIDHVDEAARFLNVDPKSIIPGCGNLVEKFETPQAPLRDTREGLPTHLWRD